MNGLEQVTSRQERRAAHPIHSARAVLTLLATLVVSVALDLWFRLVVLPRHRNDARSIAAATNRLVRLWGIVSFRICRVGLGLKVEVEGEPPPDGRVFVLSNHQSSMDIPALISLFRSHNLKFVAMEELRYGKPAVSIGLRNGGFVFVAKRNLGEDLAALREFAGGLESFEGSPLIFPEGRRTDDGSILPFHWAGSEIIRRTARLPLVPVTIDGLSEARTLKRYHLVVGARVTIRISPAISFEESERDPRATFQSIEETIRRNMDEIRSRPS